MGMWAPFTHDLPSLATSQIQPTASRCFVVSFKFGDEYAGPAAGVVEVPFGALGKSLQFAGNLHRRPGHAAGR